MRNSLAEKWAPIRRLSAKFRSAARPRSVFRRRSMLSKPWPQSIISPSIFQIRKTSRSSAPPVLGHKLKSQPKGHHYSWLALVRVEHVGRQVDFLAGKAGEETALNVAV